MALTPTTARTLLVTLRGALTAGWLAPVPTAKAFGLKEAAETDVSLPYLLRLFAIRDGALALLTVLTPPEHRRRALAVGVMVDAADVAAALLNAKDRRVPRLTIVSSAATAFLAVILGLAAMKEESNA